MYLMHVDSIAYHNFPFQSFIDLNAPTKNRVIFWKIIFQLLSCIMITWNDNYKQFVYMVKKRGNVLHSALQEWENK